MRRAGQSPDRPDSHRTGLGGCLHPGSNCTSTVLTPRSALMAQFDELWQQAELTRRKLIASGAATGFVAGFALSVQPVMAQTMVVTDATGLDAGMAQIA